MNLLGKQIQSYRLREGICGYWKEGWGGRDSQGVWDGHGHTAGFHMENQQGPAVQHRDLCSVSCGSLDERGVGGENGSMCMYG